MILHSFFCENVEVFEDDIFVRSLLVTDASLAGLLKSVDRLVSQANAIEKTLHNEAIDHRFSHSGRSSLG